MIQLSASIKRHFQNEQAAQILSGFFNRAKNVCFFAFAAMLVKLLTDTRRVASTLIPMAKKKPDVNHSGL